MVESKDTHILAEDMQFLIDYYEILVTLNWMLFISLKWATYQNLGEFCSVLIKT